jgi:transposase-like protein
MDNEASTPATIKRRRRYSREFKQRILAEARQPEASLAAVAVRHGLNPNMVHKWRQALERSGQGEFLRLPAPGHNAPATVSTPTSTAAPRDASHLDTIRMEVPTPQGQLVVHWPVSQLPESIAWLQALTR